MAPLLLLGIIAIVLYAFFAMLRYTFALIDRRHEQLRCEDALPTGEKVS